MRLAAGLQAGGKLALPSAGRIPGQEVARIQAARHQVARGRRFRSSLSLNDPIKFRVACIFAFELVQKS
jgi:hypothetical protein